MVTHLRSSVGRRIAAGMTAIAVMTVGALALAPSASAATVVIDDFAGSVLGTRTVQTLPEPNTSTTSPGTFSQSGGVGTLIAGGNGNSAAGVRLTYDMPSKDLTSGGLNNQFFLEFADISRGPSPSSYSTAANISIAVTSANGVTGSYGTGVNSTNGPYNIVLNMNCSVNPVCFTPQPDFTHVTKVQVSITFPSNYESASTLTAKLEQIRTTPAGGAVPSAPSVSVGTPQGDPVYIASGGSLQFPISTIPGTSTTTFVDSLTLSDFQLSGTANGYVVALSGNGTTWTATVGGITQSGTVKLTVPAGAVKDSWDQTNAVASSASVNVVVVAAPSLTGADLGPVYRNQPYTHTLSGGLAGATTYSVTAGALPLGLSLSSTGVLSGTPTTLGTSSFTVKATNVAGTSSGVFTMTVANQVEFTSAAAATFTVGSAGSFTVTTSGNPANPLTYTGTLPAGLTFTPGAAGTASVSGTPSAPGQSTIVVHADDASQTLTIKRNKVPTFAPAVPDSWSFAVGVAAGVTVSTSAFPVAAVTATGTLPSGLAWLDNGDGTATLSGTPAAGTGGTYPVAVGATNALGSAPSQSVDVVVSQLPALTSAAAATLTRGQSGSVSLTASGYPRPSFSATGLPSGLTLVDAGDGTATIAGTPTAPGDATVTVKATNVVGTSTQLLTLRVQDGPALTSAATASFTRGTPGAFGITTTGFPLPAITTTSTLPAGLTLTDHGDGTATIAGTPSVHGVFTVQIKATNGVATAASQVLTLTIAGAPALTGHADDSTAVGATYSTQAQATGYPVPALTVAGLPAGLSAHDNGDGTATIAGTPAAGSGGLYSVTVTAVNATGSDTTSYSLTVKQPAAWVTAEDAVVTLGSAGSAGLSASGYPTPALSAAGVPAGLVFTDHHDGTGDLTGTATQEGSFTVTLTASSSAGPSAQTSIVLTVHDQPALTGGVVVSGTGLAGSVLTATSTLASAGGVEFAGQWLRDGFAVDGATGTTYTPTNADAGAALSYRVTARAPTYNDAIVTSNAITVTGVIALADPVLSGSATVDGLLTATVPSPDPASAVVSLTWNRGSTPVGTGATYVPTPADSGQALTVTATAVLADFQTATSSATVAVSDATFSVAPTVAITGTVQVGQDLTAALAPSAPAADEYRYQWLVDGTAVPGATGDTYRVAVADKGHTVALRVTAVRAGYQDATATSAATAQVVTDKAPGIELSAARKTLRRGQSTAVTWTVEDATSISASGAWSGSRSARGTTTIRPTALGTSVYLITATNHIGTTTAQVAVVVGREAKRLPVKVSAKSKTVGSKVTITASGLDSAETYTVTIAGKKVATGTATAKGVAKVRVTVPSRSGKAETHTGKVKVIVTGALADRKGQAKLTVVPKAHTEPRVLSVKVRKAAVRASDQQRVVVTGLRAKEKVAVYVHGVRVSPSKARATTRGTYTVTLRVGTSWGTQSVKVVGAKSGRVGKATFTVVQRCPTGVWTCR